jgi:hypothetical protein
VKDDQSKSLKPADKSKKGGRGTLPGATNVGRRTSLDTTKAGRGTLPGATKAGRGTLPGSS